MVRPQADACIGDGERHRAILDFRRDPDLPLLGELDRVRNEVEDDLQELVGVRAQCGILIGRVDVEGQALGTGHRLHDRVDAVQEVRDTEFGGAHRFLARVERHQRQDLLDELEQVASGYLDALGLFVLPGRDRLRHAHLEQLRVADDGGERGAQLVRHDGEEVRLGFRRGARLVEEA